MKFLYVALPPALTHAQRHNTGGTFHMLVVCSETISAVEKGARERKVGVAWKCDKKECLCSSVCHGSNASQ